MFCSRPKGRNNFTISITQLSIVQPLWWLNVVALKLNFNLVHSAPPFSKYLLSFSLLVKSCSALHFTRITTFSLLTFNIIFNAYLSSISGANCAIYRNSFNINLICMPHIFCHSHTHTHNKLHQTISNEFVFYTLPQQVQLCSNLNGAKFNSYSLIKLPLLLLLLLLPLLLGVVAVIRYIVHLRLFVGNSWSDKQWVNYVFFALGSGTSGLSVTDSIQMHLYNIEFWAQSSNDLRVFKVH